MVVGVATALAIFCQAAIAAPLDENQEATKYLTQFGYIETSIGSGLSESTSFKDAIKTFQDFAGIEKTGKLDEETKKLMQTPQMWSG